MLTRRSFAVSLAAFALLPGLMYQKHQAASRQPFP
jgi:hypothetical protein